MAFFAFQLKTAPQAARDDIGTGQAQAMASAGDNRAFYDLGLALRKHFMVFGLDAGPIIADRHHQIITCPIGPDYDALLSEWGLYAAIF